MDLPAAATWGRLRPSWPSTKAEASARRPRPCTSRRRRCRPRSRRWRPRWAPRCSARPGAASCRRTPARRSRRTSASSSGCSPRRPARCTTPIGAGRIGAVATASEYVLPRLMASFVDEHPQVELSLSVLPRDELFAQARDHAVDVVLAGRPPRGSGLVTRARRAEPAGARRPAWARRRSTDQHLVAHRPGLGHADTTLSLLTRLQAAPPLLTLGTSGAAVAAARQGLGLTLVHEEAVRGRLDAGELAHAVPGTPVDRPWHLCTTAEPTAASRLFLRHVCDVAGGRCVSHPVSPPGVSTAVPAGRCCTA